MGEAANASMEQIYTFLFPNNTFALNILTVNIISWAFPIRRAIKVGGYSLVARAPEWVAIRRDSPGADAP